MPSSTGSQHVASIAVFGPQSKCPGETYLCEVRSFLAGKKYIASFIEQILALQDVWAILSNERDDIAKLSQGPRYLRNLSEWISTGNSSKVSNCMSSIISLPLLTIIQVCQYLQYLDLSGKCHSQFLQEVQAGGGIQGYCGGFLPAIAIACSKDEAEVVENAAIAMRVALAIGAYAELGDDESIPGATTIVCRLKKVGQGEDLVARFPGSYISAITDPKTISIVGPVSVLLKVQAYAREQGFLVQEMHIRGKVHNIENSELAWELCQLCDRTSMLRLPDGNQLQVPIRSNRTGDVITEGSLTHETVNVILASRCEWYILLTKLAKDLEATGRREHVFFMFGIGDCVPLSPFHKLQLQVTKDNMQSLIANAAQGTHGDVSNEYQYPKTAIAIVGASCRLPGAKNLDELWDVVASGRSQHSEVSASRFDLLGSFRASQDRKFVEKRKFYGNFIDDVDSFDHAFFGVNPREAINMDPQQRILLELAYEAMDSSGYLHSHRRASGDKVGCFIGASFAEYLDNTNAHAPSAYTSTGTIRAFLCGRISYYFGWSGPAEVIDTACSSSLVAINRACKAIQSGECEMALTGGINLITGINNLLDLGKAGFLSPTGQCKPFDQSADGYCRSEGGGLVFLKPLSKALSNGDQILGVIPSAGTNQGGLSAALTIPYPIAQIDLFQNILREANMKPDQVTYVETHGTGTQAGDPLEIASVREVLGGQDRTSVLNVGSIKGNIGHAETAAGVAGLLKVLAMIQKSEIPPQASYRSLNPKIPSLEADKMTISTEAVRWESQLQAAFVNSYGAAGSNAALICGSYPSPKLEKSNQTNDDEPFPMIISAVSLESLHTNVQSLRRYLEKATPKPTLNDVAFTLSRRRKFHRHIFVTHASDIDLFVHSLGNDADASVETPQVSKRIVLAFGGQTKKTVNMDKTLYDYSPPLRNYIDECDKIMIGLGYPSLLPSIFESNPLTSVVALQCGTFAMQFACAKCWIDAGLHVEAVVGHSFGELTAMVVSGVLSLHDGLKLIAYRASLMETKWGQEKGTMLVIHGNCETVQNVVNSINTDAVAPDIEIACYNAPTSQVVVGSASSIDRTEDLLRTDPRFSGIRSQRLDVTHGFHSKFTEGILDDLDQCSESIPHRAPGIPLETCTAQALEETSANRFSQHARQPVYFLNAVQRIENRLGPCIWLEAGMDSPIIPMIKRALASKDVHTFHDMKLSDAKRPLSRMCDTITSLWCEGVSVSDWRFISKEKNASKQIWLPPYQFQPTRHWLKNIDRVVEAQQVAVVEKTVVVSEPATPKPRPALVRFKSGVTAEDRSKNFRIILAADRFTKIVSGHAVRRRPLCPASMYMECAAMGLQLMKGHVGTGALSFRNLNFQAALGVDPTREAFLTLEDLPDTKGWNFVIKSQDSKSKFSTHAKGVIMLSTPSDFSIYKRLITDRIEEIKTKSGTEQLMSNRAYSLFSRVVHYAEFLQGVSHIILDGTEAIADINLSDAAEIHFDQSTTTQYCETVAIDTFIQVVGLLINSSNLVTSEDVYVATGVESATMSSACDFHKCKSWTVYAKYTCTGNDQAAGDIFVMTREGLLAMVITGAQFTKLLISKLERFLDSANAKASGEPANTAATSVAAIRSKPIPMKVMKESETSTEVYTDESEKSEVSTSLSSSPSSSKLHSSARNIEIQGTLFKLLCETSGAPLDSIKGDLTLQALGIDSLSAVELKGDIEDSFKIEIEDDEFTLDSTVQEILDFLGYDGSPEGAPLQTVAPIVSVSQAESGSASNSENSLHANGEKIELASPMGALVQCQATFEQSAAQRGFFNYWADVAAKQDELLLGYICEAFTDQGSDLNHIARGQRISMINYLPRHTKVMARLTEILEKHSLLERQGSALVRGSGPIPSKSSRELSEDFIKTFPAYSGEAHLMALTGPKLADCLTGKADAVSIMFRGAAAQKVMEEYYCASPMLSALTEHMVNFIQTVVTSSNSNSGNSPLRILEVGAGFGGTTTRLAQVLQESGVPISYKFTDISPSLVKNAKAKFAQYPWMEFQSLNLEKDMPDSLKSSFDIVIGTNCVHATSDKTKTVGRLKSLLNEQGFIVLSEVTQLVDWYDIVFGLLEGWWLANDGSTYPLQPPESWVRSFEQAGFSKFCISYSGGSSPESNTQRLLVASNKHEVSVDNFHSREKRPKMETVVYKEVGGVNIEADIYLPAHTPARAMPIAIMIHGGGHMTLSRKAIRVHQTAHLLENDVLPVSIDYRLCPEINILDGPITDVCDAYDWAQNGTLQAVVRAHGIKIDEGRIVMIGWSTGGHLAMTAAWTTKDKGLRPPTAVLSFYGPTDFESGELDVRRAEEYPGRRMRMDDIAASLSTKPITHYPPLSSGKIATDRTRLGWVIPGDPRSELVLSFFKEGSGLPLVLNGLRPCPSSSQPNRSWSEPPSAAQIASISPIFHVRADRYTTPTFLIHGTNDEIVPFRTVGVFVEALRERGVKCEFAEVRGKRHIHDLDLRPSKGQEWWEGVGVGYEFLFKELSLC